MMITNLFVDRPCIILTCSFLFLFAVAFLAVSLNYFELSSVDEREMLVWSSELVTNWDKMRIKENFFDDYDKALKKSKRPKTLRRLDDHLEKNSEKTEQKSEFGFMSLYKSSEGDSLWNKFSMNIIHKFEQSILEHESYKKVCQLDKEDDTKCSSASLKSIFQIFEGENLFEMN